MPEQAPNPSDETVLDPEGLTQSSLLAKIKILSFVTLVIVVECLAAFWFLPSAAETAEMTEAMLAANSSADASLDQDGPSEAEEVEDLSDQVEVDLGEFTVTAFQPISETTLRIDFHLYGTVREEDETEFLALMDENLHRFREQVIVTVRSADITDLTSPGLGLVKRKILEKTNRVLGKPLLRVVVFSDFSFIEQ